MLQALSTFPEGAAFAVVIQRPLVVPDLLIQISSLEDREMFDDEWVAVTLRVSVQPNVA